MLNVFNSNIIEGSSWYFYIQYEIELFCLFVFLATFYNLNISNKDNANIHCMIARVQFQIQSN